METVEKEYFKAEADDIVDISFISDNEVSKGDVIGEELRQSLARMQSVAEKALYVFNNYPRKFNN